MEYQLPEIGEGVLEAEVVQWLVAPGDAVRIGQSLAEVLTDKASVDVVSPFAGSIEALHAEAGDTVAVGQPLLSYQPAAAATAARTVLSGETAASTTAAAVSSAASPARHSVSGPEETTAAGDSHSGGNGTVQAPAVRAAPSVRRLARNLGVDLQRVPGSGPGNRILRIDVESAAEVAAADATSEGRLPASRPQPGSRIPFRGVRRMTADLTVRSKTTIPHYSYIDEADVTEMVRLRATLKESFVQRGTKLTYLAFIVKAVAAALREVPLVNASLDHEAGEIVLHEGCHLGVAVAADDGLRVPVIRDADRCSLLEIAGKIEQLADVARHGKLTRDQLCGATFTISSVGNIGGLVTTPIINLPQVGILGVGRVVKRPVFDERDHVRPAHLVYLSFSFDHRVLDGNVGAQFGNAVKARLENPATMLV